MTASFIAEIITIGDEVLSGRTVNTNAAHIARALEDAGIGVRHVTTCGDNRADLEEAFRTAWNRAHVIVTTGGIGPTHDDITMKVFTGFFNRTLVRDEAVLRNIEEFFRQRGREITERNRTQADVPSGTTVLMNREGTAPGIYLEEDGRHWFMLPGVPREMRYLMREEVLPALVRLAGERSIVRRDIHVVGWPESNLMDLIERVDGIDSVASLPDERGEITLRISVMGGSRREVEDRIEHVQKQLEAKLGPDIYGVGDVTLEEVVGTLLSERGLKLATAESCSGGLVGSRITDVPGSTRYYRGGIVAYSNDLKERLLGVPHALIAAHGAVSGEVARAMAEGARDRLGADIAVSVTGIAGPDGGTPEKPVGLVWIGLAWADGSDAQSHRFGVRRDLNKLRSSQVALDCVRRHVLATA